MSITIKTNKLTDTDLTTIADIGGKLMNTIIKTNELTDDDITNAAGKQIRILAGIATARVDIQQAINDIQDPELPTLDQDSYTLRRALNKLTNIAYIIDQLTQDLTYETADNIAATIDTKRIR